MPGKLFATGIPMRKSNSAVWLLALVLGWHITTAAGTLGDNQIFDSESLGYRLQYRVYLPEGIEGFDSLPVLYVTDGQWYINQGGLPEILDRTIEKGHLPSYQWSAPDNRHGTGGIPDRWIEAPTADRSAPSSWRVPQAL